MRIRITIIATTVISIYLSHFTGTGSRITNAAGEKPQSILFSVAAKKPGAGDMGWLVMPGSRTRINSAFHRQALVIRLPVP